MPIYLNRHALFVATPTQPNAHNLHIRIPLTTPPALATPTPFTITPTSHIYLNNHAPLLGHDHAHPM